MPSSQSIKDILKAKRPNRQSVDIALDSTLRPQIQELERQLRQARRADERENRPPEAPAIAERLEKLEQQYNESVVTFTFEDIGRSRFEALVDSHPPTAEQIKKHGDQLSWNPDTIAPALITATCVDPDMSMEDAEQIMHEWSTGDVQLLFNTALTVCLESASVPFTRTATSEMVSSDENLITALTEESPTPSS